MTAISHGPWPDVSLLLENRRAPPDARASFLFEHPAVRITAPNGEAVAPALAAIEEEAARGRYVCGYLTYEAGYFVADGRSRMGSSPVVEGPWLDFFGFESRRELTAAEVAEWLDQAEIKAGPNAAKAAIHSLERTETRETYREKVRAIKEHIGRGETYQVNFTLKCRFGFHGGAIALYRALRERQRVEFGAFLHLPERDHHVLSFSPELFLRRDGEWLTSKPMKGTAARGRSRESDAGVVNAMRSDPKTISENVMIVDLIRNDIGRIAETGTVTTDALFEVQTFETVHQMVSTVRAKLGAQVRLGEVLASVFPCGSVTGAPKARTMEIIRGLEPEARGVYTGALGFVAPNADFCFSVPIRTLVTRGDRGEMGIGSGIVAESDEDAEFAECVLKAKFLVGVNASFELIESLRFDADARVLRWFDEHAERMRASAAYFEFAFDRARMLEAISAATANCRTGLFKVRVTLSQEGEVSAAATALAPASPRKEIPWVALSARRIESASCFQRHKTTHRAAYDEEYRAWAAKGAYDVLFLNEREELVEASRHNVFIETAGRLVTPPLAAGALPGIARRRLLDEVAPRGTGPTEGSLSIADLAAAERVLLTNSVRGVVEVKARLR